MLTMNVDRRRVNVLTLLAESGVNQEQMQGCEEGRVRGGECASHCQGQQSTEKRNQGPLQKI